MRRLTSILLLLLAGCVVVPKPPMPLILPPMPAARPAWTPPPFQLLSWNYDAPMPMEGVVFEVWRSERLPANWLLYAVTNKPPVLILNGFYIVRARELETGQVSEWNSR